MDYNDIINQISSGTIPIGVVGMGYVGLPLALNFAVNGFVVVGFDTDVEKVNQLKAGKSYVSHISNESIGNQVRSKRLIPSTNFKKLSEMGVIIICVPTPLTTQREPDLSFLKSTALTIRDNLKHGQLVILESTTYPGCCSKIVKPILEQTGLLSERDFYLAYSPEREDPGNPKFNAAGIPKVVGADGDKAKELAIALYNKAIVSTVPVSSMEVAEAVKLTENIFRSVNIALVNELKVIYHKMDIDIWEVIEAAKTKPFGYMPFYPGPGLGGHCIPIDPFYLTWCAQQVGEETKFIELAGEINSSMPEKVIDVMTLALNDRFQKSLQNSRVLLLGLAYKKNVNDTRESPAFVLIELMEELGAKVEYFDPFVPVIPETRNHMSLAGRKSMKWAVERLAEFDVAVICTDHDNINYSELSSNCQLLIDTRNVFKSNSENDNVVKA
ncbi:MAG: nucleotide sugar dehydrogenase [Pseudomonadota bacterium]|nr:nucleotide sugar dehydrogenase [Pseudomonadota bacterium]